MELVNVYDPDTGEGRVVNARNEAEWLARGFIAQAEMENRNNALMAQKHQEWLADPATEEERFRMLRTTRDAKITATDYLMTADYPLDDAARAQVAAYRQALRDLPAQDGAPWDGGGEATPWPETGTFQNTEE